MNGFWEQVRARFSGYFLWILEEHPGKLIGTALGLVFGLIFVLLGFWRTVILILFIAAGYMLGKRKDENKALFSWLERAWNRIIH